MHWIYLPLLVALMGCGTIQKWALRSSSPVFQKSSNDLLKEGNWDFFRESAPSNLKFVELLWQQDRDNLKLLSVLVKGYAGYAFAVPETLALGDEWAGVEESLWKKNAIIYYTRALDYGTLYLTKRDVKRKDLLGDEAKLSKKLKNELDEDDLMALLYTAQAWGSLINLQKDNVALVAQIPKVKVLFDHVCSRKPKIDQNVCDIFYAQYEASRPRMLGGNPAKAKKLFETAIKKHPQHLLIRVSYIQYLLLPAMEEGEYEKEARVLRDEFAKFEDMNRDELVNKSAYKKASKLNLYNAIAKKRFELIEKNKSKIF